MTLYEISEKKLYYLNYSKNTIKTYLNYIGDFENNVNKHHSRLCAKDVQIYIDNFKFSSVSQQNQIISALKFAWEKGLGKKYLKIDFSRPRKERKLPRIVEKNVLVLKINFIPNLKHKAMLSLLYGTGLRASELLNLKISDVDSNRMLILVRNSKFNKDRYVPFSLNNLKLLRTYFKKYRPNRYLFEGEKGKYTYSSLKNISLKYLSVTPHILRHSYATSLIESKESLRSIQFILGHNSSKTTEIYTHVSNDFLSSVATPI